MNERHNIMHHPYDLGAYVQERQQQLLAEAEQERQAASAEPARYKAAVSALIRKLESQPPAMAPHAQKA